MKTILIWDPRFPNSDPVRLKVPDAAADALVAFGIAAAADPFDAGRAHVLGEDGNALYTEDNNYIRPE